jgi:hypothetical protein
VIGKDARLLSRMMPQRTTEVVAKRIASLHER